MSEQRGRLQSEFDGFLLAGEIAPPQAVSRVIRERVMTDLEPSAWRVFAKLSAIHVVMGTATLSLCPQFGLSWIREGMGLMGLFMRFGDTACMIGCGATFMAGSLFVAAVTLRPEEVRLIRKQWYLQISALGLLSMAALVCFGELMVAGLAVAWFGGSFVGSLLTLELGWRMRAYKFFLTRGFQGMHPG